MNHGHCKDMDSSVIDSREYNGRIRRRRKCLGCGIRFSTLEIPVDEVDRLTFADQFTSRIDQIETAVDRFLLNQ